MQTRLDRRQGPLHARPDHPWGAVVSLPQEPWEPWKGEAESGEITAAWHDQSRLWISLSRQELTELEAVITWEGDSRVQECERMR